ncbi:MAG: DoxX family protein [Simkaniaceae bacterium]|nr:MAG: DoxX family protein [Simkaniaceae bacterium]
MNKTVFFIARGCFCLIFIVAGIGKLMNWQGSVDSLILTFSEWSMHLEGTLMSSDIHEVLVSSAYGILGVATFLEIVGALLIFTGIKVRMGAFLLLLFMIPVTLIMHPFWFSVGSEMHREISIFLKNLSLIGALLYFLVGPQPQRAS